jgi:hypothetical protein
MGGWYIALFSVAASVVVSMAASAVIVAYNSGRFTATLEAHTKQDDDRFKEVSDGIKTISGDVKEILKHW